MSKIDFSSNLTSELITKNVDAYFWISILFDKKLESYIDPQIEYIKLIDDHNAYQFWESTQYNIYHSFGNQKESLMGILFNEINRKINIHIESKYSKNILKQEISIKEYDENILISVSLPSTDEFIDDFIFSTKINGISCDRQIPINKLINNGYRNAEIKSSITANEIILSILSEISNDKTIKNAFKTESPTAVERLLKMLIGFSFPSKTFPQRKFSILTTEAYKNPNGKVISNGGLFLIWNNSANLFNIIHTLDYYKLLLNVSVQNSRLTTSRLLAFSGRESIKSAISAIMARNMSHNLGSHFISNTKHYFSNLAENDEDEQRQKDYRGIRHTLQYIQERMDFIATIVSTDRFPYGPVNVKSQIFDELTPDEFGGRHEKATTNFLLDYIVFSEDISKQSNLSKSSIKLSLKLISDNGKEFGGQDIENQSAKEVFAKLNLAVPGGILGRHAIFTIIENVIRNSAKHDKENIPKDGLNVSIKIGKGYIIIFDNKKNAKKKIKDDFLIDELQKRYTDIKILSDGAIDKSNKGLKEILISALWLNNYSLADWFGEYENTSTEDKIKKLSEVLKIVTVEDNGDITDDGENLGYYIALDKYEEVYHIEGNRVKIVEGDKIYYSSISGIKADIIAANRDYEVLIDENLGQNGDASTDSNNILRLSDLYPRFFENKDEKELPQTEEMMKAIIARNTGMKLEDLEGIDIHIEPKDYNILADKSKKNHCIWHAKGEASGIKKNDILYKNHLSILKTEEIDRVIAAYEDAAYIDSISGGDFTGTITQPFFLQNDFNRLKVLESALTEFVIIDERVFKNYGHGFKPLDGDVKLESNKSILEAEKIFNEVEDLLCLEKPVDDIADSIYNRYNIVLNVSLLNGDNKEQIRKDIDIKIAKKKSKAATEAEKTENNSDNISALHKMIEKRKLHIYDIDKNGNILNLKGKSIANVIKFNDMDKLCSPTFLSIHLSIIEKITKENGVAASQVMANLKKLFGNTKFVTIHSGRGNLSAELEKELRDYAFLSLSAIQAAMDDSKYFLSQLLYNNCYIGKGRLNHK